MESTPDVVAHRVAIPVFALHVKVVIEVGLKLLLTNSGGQEALAPFDSIHKHGTGLINIEIFGTKEFEKDHIGPLISFGVQQWNTPQADIFRVLLAFFKRHCVVHSLFFKCVCGNFFLCCLLKLCNLGLQNCFLGLHLRNLNICSSLNPVPNAQVCYFNNVWFIFFSFFKKKLLSFYFLFYMYFYFILLFCIIKIKCFFFTFVFLFIWM